MAPSPFRRRKAAKTVRNLAIAEAALAIAKDRAVAATGRGSRRPSGKLLLIGGAVAAAGAAALLKRDKVAGLLPSRAGQPAPPVAPAPPQPSNYDAPGPVANTATPIPAPDAQGQPPAIDEQAEEAAAAAEAGAIGGSPSAYAAPELGEPAGEAQRPLAEAGEGESEGQEQAEAELADNATFRDAAPSDTERQLEDTIEQADQPQAGETPDPVAAGEGGQESFLPPTATDSEPEPAGEPAPEAAVEPAPEPAPAGDAGPATDETAADTPGGGISGRPFSGLDAPDSDPEPSASESAPESGSGSDDDWRTWSGRSVNP
jgi:nicotinate-nucleotide--dimethylbenzimidazole phosphoribosyltransferase